jgi:hypothetical protein
VKQNAEHDDEATELQQQLRTKEVRGVFLASKKSARLTRGGERATRTRGSEDDARSIKRRFTLGHGGSLVDICDSR